MHMNLYYEEWYPDIFLTCSDGFQKNWEANIFYRITYKLGLKNAVFFSLFWHQEHYIIIALSDRYPWQVSYVIHVLSTVQLWIKQRSMETLVHLAFWQNKNKIKYSILTGASLIVKNILLLLKSAMQMSLPLSMLSNV